MVAPVARVEVVRETHFGVTVGDPYRWMEEPSAEYESWLARQGGHAREVLDGLPHRKVLLDRIGELRRGEPGLHTLAVAGGRVFALREDPQAGLQPGEKRGPAPKDRPRRAASCLAVGDGEALHPAGRGRRVVVGVAAVADLPPPGAEGTGDERGVGG